MRFSILVLVCVVVLPACGDLASDDLWRPGGGVGQQCPTANFWGHSAYNSCSPVFAPAVLQVENQTSFLWTAAAIRILPEGKPADVHLEQPLLPGQGFDLGVYEVAQYEIHLTGYDPETLVSQEYWTEWSGGCLVIEEGQRALP